MNEANIQDYLDEVRKQIAIERQMDPDYLIDRMNRVPVKERNPDLTRPRGLVMGLIEALTKRKAPPACGS